MKWSIPEKVVERGRQYLNEGRVLSVTPDPENKVWHAVVLGSEEYLVDLDATAKEEDYCQCPYWEEHHFCKHTVAVELYLRKQGKSRIIQGADLEKKTRFSVSEMFTNGFSRLAAPRDQKPEDLVVEFQVETLPTNPYHPELDILGISLKVGQRNQNRTYIVKNIYRFLQSFTEGKRITINKQNSFLLAPEAFSPAVTEVLCELAGLANTQQMVGQAGIQVKGKLDKKYLFLPVNYGRGLIEKMQVAPTSLLVGDHKLKQIEFRAGEKPLQFSIKEANTVFPLRIEKDFQRVLSSYSWGILGDKVYQLDHEALEVYLTLDQLLKRIPEGEIPYPKKELSGLFKQVVPLLRKIGEVQVAPNVMDFISDEPLKVIYIFRKKQGQIAVQLDYQYGPVTFSSDPAKQVMPENHPEILRDQVKENRAKHLLLKFGFTETATGFEKAIPQGVELYQFFSREIPSLQQLGEVRMGKKLRELYLDAGTVKPKIEVSNEDSWLDVRFDVSGIPQQDVDALLKSLQDNDQFYTLSNGQVVDLSNEAFRETSQALQQIRSGMKSRDGVIKLPLHQGLQLKEGLQGGNVSFTREFERMIADLLHPEKFAVALPDGLQAELRSYQEVGFKWLKMLSHYHFGGILADEMGLGKTLQAITFLLSEKQETGRLRALIVAPASLTYNWQQELKKFAPSLRSVVVSGNKDERSRLLAEDAEILITSYASLRQDSATYQQMAIDYLLLDEAQMVKNSTTKTSKALQALTVPHRFALSGTPIENNLEELWSIFEMIMPGFFPSRLKFRELDTETIAKMVKPFILRRDKAHVLKDLPEKLETNYYSALTEDQKKVYLAYLQQMRETIGGMDAATFKKNRISILAGLTRLRQICCDPKLFLDDYEGSSGKLEQVKDLVTAAKENGRRILLFSQFTGMLTIIEEELQKLGYSSFYLRGSTPPKDRIKMVDAFNAGEKDVFLISLKAGGTGLNLTGADTVILYDLWWNPAVEEQAAGRAHRIGQEKVVEVWRMIAEGTIEERMDLLQQDKRELFQKVIQGNETQAQQLTEDDIRMILSIGE